MVVSEHSYNCVRSAKALDAQISSGYFTTLFNNLIGQFNPCQQRAILRAKACNSSWLSVVPLAAHQFDLTCQEFHDALALRYKKPLLNLPPYCDGCGAPFSVDHALDCRVGGLVGRRYNEVRDAIGDLASLVWGQVQREPVICEETADGSCNETLVGDLRIRGVWQPQADAVFDVRVVDTDAPSYRSRSPDSVLHSAEVEKKKYPFACVARRASFTPLCCSVDGMLGAEANFFLRRLADRLSSKWEKPYSLVMGWVHTRLSFAILRATMICVRGSRMKWRSLGISDGASIFETV